MSTNEDERIKLKLEQDFPFYKVQIRKNPITEDRGIFFNNIFTGFSYNNDKDTSILKEYGQERYAEIIFYESLRHNIYSFLSTNKV